MNSKTKAGIGVGVLAIAGGIFSLVHQDQLQPQLRTLSVVSQESQPECNTPFEATSPTVNGPDYSATFKWTNGPPTNAPCWKDLYAGAIGNDMNNLTWASADHSTGLAAEDHVRVYFTASPTPTPQPTVTPTPTPTPTATPTPTPTPSNICKPNQLISTGCICMTKLIGPPNKRRCQ